MQKFEEPTKKIKIANFMYYDGDNYLESADFDLVCKLDLASLNDILAHLNSALDWDDPVVSFQNSMNALNKLWNSAYRIGFIKTGRRIGNDGKDETKVPSDGEKFRALIDLLSSNESGNIFLRSPEFRELVELAPRVMDMKVLEDAGYDPSKIGNRLRKKAAEKHTSLFNGYKSHLAESSPNDLLNRLSALLYIIRSNLDHGEKTSRGPDIEKNVRDKTVCKKALPVTRRLLEILLNELGKYLATYGNLQEKETLQECSKEPKNLLREWTVGGNVKKSNGLLYFNWISNGERLNVTIYEVSEETDRRLDEHEGNGYRRIYVPALNTESKAVLLVTIYAKSNSFNFA